MASDDNFPPETIDERIEQLTRLPAKPAQPEDREDAALVQTLRQIYQVPLSETDRASLKRTRQRIMGRRTDAKPPARQVRSGNRGGDRNSLRQATQRRKRSPMMQVVTALAAVLLIGVLVGSWFLVVHLVGKRQLPPSKSAGGSSAASPTVVPFPLSIYPLPHTPTGTGSISFPGQFTCPSLSGLQVPSRGVPQGILASLNGLLSARSELQAQTYADRAAWPLVATFWAPGATRPKAALSPEEVEIVPAQGSTYAPVYQSLCGKSIVADSWLAVWCTSTTTGLPLPPSTCLQKQPDLTNYYYFLDRNAHWLLWGVQGGA